MSRAVGVASDGADGQDGQPVAPSRRRRLRRAAPPVVAAAALVAGGFALGSRRGSSDAPTRAEVAGAIQATVGKAVEDLQAAPAPSVAVYQAILPSIVVIQADRANAGAADDHGLGTGVVVNQQGAVMTARHVVAGATRITLTFADGTSSPATVASEQPERDIAVLTADSPPQLITPAVLGGGIRVGDEAYAVGHPLGLVASMSAGVVSGLDRTIGGTDGSKLDGLIQFDTAVNPGNSGGPLLNRAGQVVGIVTALANPSKQNFFTGIGFAVPIGAAAGGAGGPPQ